MRGLSIIVLARNDEEGVAALVTRVDAALTARKIAYEIIFVTNTPSETTKK